MSTKAAKKSSNVLSSSSTSGGQSPQAAAASASILGSTAQATSTPMANPNMTSSSQRSSSPLSPTRYSRLQEKQDLQNLNNRLAHYIENVRHLETENFRLTREVQTSQETVTREVSTIKSMYEQEISDARKLLDETARERAKLEIDTKRLWDQNEELKSNLEKKMKELQAAERNFLIYETRYNDTLSKLNQSQAERKKLSDKEKELEKEVNRLKDLLNDARKNLEEETLQRIDLENNIQSLKEEIAFKDQVFQQELLETRSRRQVEISEIDGRLAEQYEVKLEQSLQELRDTYEAQLRANREETELLYETKFKNLAAQAQRNSEAASLAVEELRVMRVEKESLTKSVHELEAANKALIAQLSDLKNLRDAERAQFEERIAALKAELNHLRDEVAQQLKEYQDLTEVKIVLDMEIAAYRKLLESEEARLNITPNREHSGGGHPSGRSTPSKHAPVRLGKRKRTLLEESEEHSSTDYSVTGTARSDVDISEADPQGRFVKLTNKGNKEITLGGWQIIRKVGTLETTFKFHRTAKIDAGATVTVWSADTGASHEPPSNIVMKGQKWFVGDCMSTKLLNMDGEEMATSERKRQQMSSSVSRHRESSAFRTSEDLHYQQADPAARETCSVM